MRKHDHGQHDTSTRMTLCAGGGCCPEVEFEADGRLRISDLGQEVVLTREQAKMLLEVLERRWR
jgi:hypothetical protein